MRVFDYRDGNGQLRGFEVENLWLGRRGVSRVLRSIPGVRIITAKWSWWARDDFCEFELNGIRFYVEEPFGDSSRYWIGPRDQEQVAQLDVIREKFLSLRRPEWISARLIFALILLFFGTSAGRRNLESMRIVGVFATMAGATTFVSWALAVKRGHYRSRAIEEFPRPLTGGDS